MKDRCLIQRNNSVTAIIMTIATLILTQSKVIIAMSLTENKIH